MAAVEPGEAARRSFIMADGMVEATASPGPVVSLVLDARAKRMDRAELAEHVTAALNAALHDLRSDMVTADEPLPDLASLMTQLRDIQDEAFRSLHEIGGKINAAVIAAGQSARLDVSATSEPTASLFDQTRDVLAMVQSGGTADPDLRGWGVALDGQIRVLAAAGRIETVEIESRTMRLPAVDLADGLAEAANAALRDLRERTRDAGAVNLDGVRERTREIRDLSVQNMQSYAQAVADLMAQLDGPGAA
jgi:hypothetical protein